MFDTWDWHISCQSWSLHHPPSSGTISLSVYWLLDVSTRSYESWLCRPCWGFLEKSLFFGCDFLLVLFKASFSPCVCAVLVSLLLCWYIRYCILGATNCGRRRCYVQRTSSLIGRHPSGHLRLTSFVEALMKSHIRKLRCIAPFQLLSVDRTSVVTTWRGLGLSKWCLFEGLGMR